MKFRALPIVAILFIAAAMIVQFVISFSLEKEHVREVVEYKMQMAQKDFFYVLLGFHNAGRVSIKARRAITSRGRTVLTVRQSVLRMARIVWIIMCATGTPVRSDATVTAIGRSRISAPAHRR